MHFIQLLTVNVARVSIVSFQKCVMDKTTYISNQNSVFDKKNVSFEFRRCRIEHTSNRRTQRHSLSSCGTHLPGFFFTLHIFMSDNVEMLTPIICDISLKHWHGFCLSSVFRCCRLTTDYKDLCPHCWTSEISAVMWDRNSSLYPILC